MAEERDERWVLFVLGAIIVGYVVYLNRDSIEISGAWLRKLMSAVPYAAAPIFAALSAIWRKRRAAAARRQWDEGALREGILRDESNVRVRFLNGRASRPFAADLRLTRSALYVFDKSGKRDPMRFAISLDSVNQLGVFDAKLYRRPEGGTSTVTVEIVGRARMALELVTINPEGWWTDIRRALNLSSDLRDGAREPVPQGEEHGEEIS